MTNSEAKLTTRFPVIETERLLLRPFEDDDLEPAVRLFNDDDVQKYLAAENRRTPEQMRVSLRKLRRRWAERGFGIWCVRAKETGAMTGYCGFQYFFQTADVEILFAYLKEFWGQGLASEAACACLRFGFENLSFSKIYAAAHAQNRASQRVLQKLGMIFEQQDIRLELDTLTFSIVAADFTPHQSFYKVTYQKFEPSIFDLTAN